MTSTSIKIARLDGRRAGVDLARDVNTWLDGNDGSEDLGPVIAWAEAELVERAHAYTAGQDLRRSEAFLHAALDALIEVLRAPMLDLDPRPVNVMPFSIAAAA